MKMPDVQTNTFYSRRLWLPLVASWVMGALLLVYGFLEGFKAPVPFYVVCLAFAGAYRVGFIFGERRSEWLHRDGARFFNQLASRFRDSNPPWRRP
jgi:hypothetical protein